MSIKGVRIGAGDGLFTVARLPVWDKWGIICCVNTIRSRGKGHAMLKRFALWVLVAALLCGGALAQAEDEGFFRMDRDSRQAWRGQVANLRLLTKGQYTFGKAKPRYRIDADYTPSVKGLNRLNISGSAQFSEPQFHQLATTLRKLAGGRRVYVIDLRQESHVFLNGNPISWYAEHNWANAGKTLEQIRQDEAERFGTLIGKTIRAYGVAHDQKSGQTKISVRSCVTEEAAVKSEGFGYLRLPAPDLAWPPPEVIDAFIEFVKGIDMKRVWLHFHCHAGTGRTGIFMMLYDKMKNPKVSMRDIAIRHTLTGSEYPLYDSGSDSFHGRLNRKKARMMPLLFQYVEKNHASNYAVSWSAWLDEQAE